MTDDRDTLETLADEDILTVTGSEPSDPTAQDTDGTDIETGDADLGDADSDSGDADADLDDPS